MGQQLNIVLSDLGKTYYIFNYKFYQYSNESATKNILDQITPMVLIDILGNPDSKFVTYQFEDTSPTGEIVNIQSFDINFKRIVFESLDSLYFEILKVHTEWGYQLDSDITAIIADSQERNPQLWI